MKEKFVVRTVSKAKIDKSYIPKTKRKYGKVMRLPTDWIGKHCLVIRLKNYEETAIYGKMRALELVDRLLKGGIQ